MPRAACRSATSPWGPRAKNSRVGDTTIDIIATPGHSPGTLSYLFPVKDGARTLTVAYSGGTAFNFPRLAENFAIYRDSASKMLAAARAAGATVLMTNHTEFDRAYDRARIAQLPRAAGEPHRLRDRRSHGAALFRDATRLRRGTASSMN